MINNQTVIRELREVIARLEEGELRGRRGDLRMRDCISGSCWNQRGLKVLLALILLRGWGLCCPQKTMENNKQLWFSKPLTLWEFRRLTADMSDDTVIVFDDGEEARDIDSLHTHWHGAISFVGK